MVDMEGMNAGWGHCIYRPPTWIDNLPWTIRIVVSFAHVHPWTYRCCLLPRVSVFRRQPTALLGHNATTHHESVESQNGSYAQPKCGNTTSPRRRPIQNVHTHPFRHLPSSHQTDPGSGHPQRNANANAILPAAASHQRSTISRLPVCLPCNQTTHTPPCPCVCAPSQPSVSRSPCACLAGWGREGGRDETVPACVLGLAGALGGLARLVPCLEGYMAPEGVGCGLAR